MSILGIYSNIIDTHISSYLSNNQLSGTIPPELGQLGNLQILYVYFMYLQ